MTLWVLFALGLVFSVPETDAAASLTFPSSPTFNDTLTHLPGSWTWYTTSVKVACKACAGNMFLAGQCKNSDKTSDCRQCPKGYYQPLTDKIYHIEKTCASCSECPAAYNETECHPVKGFKLCCQLKSGTLDVNRHCLWLPPREEKFATCPKSIECPGPDGSNPKKPDRGDQSRLQEVRSSFDVTSKMPMMTSPLENLTDDSREQKNVLLVVMMVILAVLLIFLVLTVVIRKLIKRLCPSLLDNIRHTVVHSPIP